MASSYSLLVVLVAVALSLPATAATNYTVGNSTGWTLGYNYTNWTAGKSFEVGDTILFRYSPQRHDVTEVSQSDYNICRVDRVIRQYEDGNTTIRLNSSRSRFFVCAVSGHCIAGMKLAVTAVSNSTTANAPASDTPPPPPGGNDAFSIKYSTSAIGFSGLVMVLALVC